ncbi:Ferrous iron transporter B [Enterobacterales bacterium 8AC]|nr:Ferrous iron transporter B [Enterobacterales bacterium 8AC]
MKKNFIAIAMLASSSVLSVNALAADAQVKFTGEITDVACKVDSASPSLEVKMGKIAKTAFSGGSGAKAAATKFTLELKDCPDAAKKARVKFDGTSAAGDNNVLMLTGAGDSGVAKGIGIQLSDDANAVLPLFTESKYYTLEEGVTNQLNFVASYIAIADYASIEPGKADATANFTVNYN